jgi:hypothetical protein
VANPTGPNAWLIPNSRTIRVARSVAPARSFDAPVLGWPNTSCSATRPPIRIASESFKYPSVYRWRSSIGSCSVTPNA